MPYSLVSWPAKVRGFGSACLRLWYKYAVGILAVSGENKGASKLGDKVGPSHTDFFAGRSVDYNVVQRTVGIPTSS